MPLPRRVPTAAPDVPLSTLEAYVLRVLSAPLNLISLEQAMLLQQYVTLLDLLAVPRMRLSPCP